jgi:TRAP-type C4-dicarboxylate transport system substrate-binding protein
MANNVRYLTTRLLKSAAQKAFREASKKAMKDHGYVVVAENGQIIKKFSNGNVEVLEKIEPSKVGLFLD